MTVKIEPFCNCMDQMCQIGNHHWSVPRLFELSRELPVMDIPLAHLNIYDRLRDVTIRQLVGHMKSVLSADLSYPIILDEDGEIMDGRHRIMRALLEGHETIRAVRFEKNPDPCRYTED